MLRLSLFGNSRDDDKCPPEATSIDEDLKAEILSGESIKDIDTGFKVLVKNERGEEEYILPESRQSDGTTRVIETHYDPLLDSLDVNDLFGKDSVWFTEKKEDGNTELYPLTDFKGLSKLSSIRKSYMNGQFGAVPEIYV